MLHLTQFAAAMVVVQGAKLNVWSNVLGKSKKNFEKPIALKEGINSNKKSLPKKLRVQEGYMKNFEIKHSNRIEVM